MRMCFWILYSKKKKFNEKMERFTDGAFSVWFFLSNEPLVLDEFQLFSPKSYCTQKNKSAADFWVV